jgi:prenyltransferase beta subunit
MRPLLCLVALAIPATLTAQEVGPKTAEYALSLQDPATGAFRVTPDGKPGLRASNGGVKVLKLLGKDIPHLDKLKAFVEGCYDTKSGTFAEPGGKPDCAINSVGLMVALELGLPRAKFVGAMTYLKDNVKTFEEARLAAAAVEAWGVADCPFSLDGWLATAAKVETATDPRAAGGVLAMFLRLGKPSPNGVEELKTIFAGQNADGGWGMKNETTSDLETTYRVVRGLSLAGAEAASARQAKTKVERFIKACKNADGGLGVKPGDKSTLNGTYYAAMVEKFLGDLPK